MLPRKGWNSLENKELDQVMHLLFASSCNWEYESFPPPPLLLCYCLLVLVLLRYTVFCMPS